MNLNLKKLQNYFKISEILIANQVYKKSFTLRPEKLLKALNKNLNYPCLNILRHLLWTKNIYFKFKKMLKIKTIIISIIILTISVKSNG